MDFEIIMDKIIHSMDYGQIPVEIFVDLSKAYDTIDHSFLLTKSGLNGVKGLSKKILKLFK